MAYFSKAKIEQLKQAVSLPELARMQGHQLKKQGKDLVTLCPFHEEKTPSMVLTPDKNLYHCFGCDAGGSVLDWVMHTEKLEYQAALRRLQALAGALPDLNAVPFETEPLIDVGDDGQGLILQVMEHYHKSLINSPQALEWLEKRGLNNAKMIVHFNLGYSDHSLRQVLPSSKRVAGKEIRIRLEQLGLVREANHQEHLRGCFIVPVMGCSEAAEVSQRGRVMQMYGRRIAKDIHVTRQGGVRHSYLRAPLRGVWNEQALIGSDEIILCEALIDALTFWAAGFRHVISSYGVNGFTEDHRQALLYHGIKRMLIAYDADEAGNRAADKLAPTLTAQGFDVWRVNLPQGMDVNEYAVKSGQPERALGLALQQAVQMSDIRGQISEKPVPVIFEHEKAVQMNTQTMPLAINAAPGPETPSLLAARPNSPTTPPVDSEAGSAPGGELLLTFGSRVWRMRGWQKNHNSEVMKVNVQVRDETVPAFHIDTFDMYHAKSRAAYIKQAYLELGCEESIIKRDIGRVLLALEQQQDKQLSELLAPKEEGTLSAEEEQAALELLQAPNLTERVIDDLAACGVVGESSNLLAGYLAAVSRKLDRPLAVLIQSSSAAGKSSLMDAILGLMPQEERVQYSAMTGQSLYYLGEKNLQHRILAIAEEEGVRQAAYALKLLQSDGELTIASTGKDESSGDLVTREYTVKGPVMLMLTTTAIDVDEELLNRCLVLTINESREQTQAIHALQRHRQTLEGLLAENEREHVETLHQNAQRLLKPLNVVNPYAHQLTFLSDKTRTRRDHMKYLTLIQAIALLHQYQREVKTVSHRGQVLQYIEVTKEDITLANRLAHEILGRTLDEMPPQTRKLLLLLKAWTDERSRQQAIKPEEFRFTRREVRAMSGWGDTQLKIHLGRLVEMEYLLLFRRGLTYEYALMWDGSDGAMPHLCGLLDVESTRETARKGQGDDDRSGPGDCQSGSGRPLVGGWPGSVKEAQSQEAQGLEAEPAGLAADTLIREKKLSLRSLPVVCIGAFVMQAWEVWLPMPAGWFRMRADTGLRWRAGGSNLWSACSLEQLWKMPQVT